MWMTATALGQLRSNLRKLPHKGKLHDGKHAAIIELDLWERVQARMRNNKHGTERPAAKHPRVVSV